MLRSGEYYYSNTLRDTDKVTFIGNSTAHIEGINIMQFPNGLEVPIGGIILYEGEIIPGNYEEVSEATLPKEGLKYIKRVR